MRELWAKLGRMSELSRRHFNDRTLRYEEGKNRFEQQVICWASNSGWMEYEEENTDLSSRRGRTDGFSENQQKDLFSSAA